jgi:ATP-dependent exoDNAse (exonuclease V) beta subunit
VKTELPLPPDQAGRDAIVRGRERSMLVEASAGTGKTYTLVEALLHAALDADPGISLSQTAAVTFTEKAAGELKARLSQRLLEVSRTGAPARRERARRALDDVERAEVCTIHAFCQTLLKERPIDAGVDPGFTPIDAITSAALAHRVWHDWWRREVVDSPNGAVAEALRNGTSLGRPEEEWPGLSQLALKLYDDRARLDGAPPAEEAPRLLVGRLREWSNELARAVSEAKYPHSPKVTWLRQIAEWLGVLANLAGRPKFAEVASQMPAGDFRGAKGLWAEDRYDEIRKLVDRIKRHTEKLGRQARYWPLLAGVLARLRDPETGFFGAIAEEKRRRGLIDFDDLLLFARNLLRHSAPARAHFRTRFRLLAVDEFQDTDPLQMEIVYRLSAADGGEPDWRTIVPEPGRLLLVGDPKQSIYRFRRADVESYRHAAKGLERQTLSANRRSLPALLEWINAAFGELLVEESERPWEIAYEKFEAWRETEDQTGPRVVYLEPPADFRGAGSEAEADAVATFVHESIAKGRFQPGEAAILVRTNDRVAAFQEALDRFEIPSVLEGGRDFFEREETAAVLAVLSALEDPRDAVSVYAALKSAFFSFSDEDLFRAKTEGVSFDFTHKRPGPVTGRLSDAFALLARLRRERHARPAAETLADLYEETGAVETAASKRVGGLQAQANLERISVAARALSEGGLSFGALVRALEDRTGSEAGEPRAFEEEVEAVRILTMHKAKGLEFKVTIITGLGADSGGRSGSGPVVFGGNEAWGASLGIGGISVDTPDLVVVRDQNRERDLAEEKRLFYVACTRARDLLVISHYRDIKDTQKGVSDAGDRDSTPFGRFRPHLDRAADRPGLVERQPPRPGPRAVAAGKRSAARPKQEIARSLEELARRPDALAAERSLKLRRAGQEDCGKADAETAAEDLTLEERERSAVSGPAVRIGSAVHEAMQMIVERGTEAGRAAQEASAAWELAPERAHDVAELVQRLAGSELFTRSAAASRRFAELPVQFRDAAGFLVEGKIDLLFEEESGFVLVDYKTDRDIRKRMPEHAAQLADYKAALSSLGLPKPVAAAYLLSARNGKAIAI